MAIQRLPVRFAIDRAGLVGADGATHAGAYDVGFLANLPGFVVMAAADEAELVRMVATAAALDDRIARLRVQRDAIGPVNLRADEDKRALEAERAALEAKNCAGVSSRLAYGRYQPGWTYLRSSASMSCGVT